MLRQQAAADGLVPAGEGVCVQASTLGALEALLEFLRTPEVAIAVSGINIGPVRPLDLLILSMDAELLAMSCLAAMVCCLSCQTGLSGMQVLC